MTTPELTAITGVGAAAWTLLLIVAVLAIIRARHARKEMRRQTRVYSKWWTRRPDSKQNRCWQCQWFSKGRPLGC